MLKFEEEEFYNALKELESPNLDGYELFVEVMGVKIYRRYIQSSGLYEYKVIGFLECNTETCQKVYMDLEYRKKWDSYVKELYKQETEEGNFIYWNVNYPFPLANRDYTYIRECRSMAEKDEQRRPTWVILAKSKSVESVPEKSGIVRVGDYKQFLIIQKGEKENSTRAFMHYYDNPGGSIPSWLINWAAKKGVPSFLTDMKKACEGYDKYLQKKGHS